MDEKKKKVVLGSVAGVAMIAAAVLIAMDLMPASPKLELSDQALQAAQQTTQDLDKATDQVASAAAVDKEDDPADPSATVNLENKGGRRFKLKKPE